MYLSILCLLTPFYPSPFLPLTKKLKTSWGIFQGSTNDISQFLSSLSPSLLYSPFLLYTPSLIYTSSIPLSYIFTPLKKIIHFLRNVPNPSINDIDPFLSSLSYPFFYKKVRKFLWNGQPSTNFFSIFIFSDFQTFSHHPRIPATHYCPVTLH